MPAPRRVVPMAAALLLLGLCACGGAARQAADDSDLPDVSVTDVKEEHLSVPVAVVNGAQIYRSTYEQVLTFLRDQVGTGTDDSVERYLSARDNALERVIDMELLYQEAVRRGYDLKPEELKVEYARRVAKAGSEEAYLAGARKQHFSKSEVLSGIRHQLAVEHFVRKVIEPSITESDDELRAYYKAHPKPFTSEKTVRLGSIFVNAPAGGSSNQQSAALTKISKALAALKNGEDFEKVAREYSEDAVAVLGGNLGFIKRGVLPKNLEQAAFSLKPGEVSNILRSDLGYHLLMVYETKGGELRPFDEVKEEIRKRVFENKKAEQVAKLVNRLREEAKVERQLI
ncbi:MAG TPA: peptidyl-prolyl cis-trans isomerase [Candidatus Saccharimonadales bacterium]|nr:peptidyl-prolyl cis-trans isomerase [Candidatus Saccharimonadales bacterium]